MTSERKPFQPVPPNSVCRTYELLHERRLVSFPITLEAKAKIEAIVANITSAYFGKEIYKTTEEKAVAYLYFLIKDHPFTDGNKRTASLTFSVVCELNKLVPQFGNGNPTLDELAVFIEKIQDQNHHDVIQQIANLLFSSYSSSPNA